MLVFVQFRYASALCLCVSVLAAKPVHAGPLTDSLKAYWSFDELNDASNDGATFGTDYFEDLSGNNRNAVIQREGSAGNFVSNDPTGAGILGGAFRVERGTGENHHFYTTTADTDNGLDLTSNDAFTFSFWTQSDYNQAFQRGNYFGKEETATFDVRNPDSGYLFARSGGNNQTSMQFHVNDGTTFNNGQVVTFPNDGSDQWDNDEWAYWTLAYDGNGNLNFYVNGQLEDTESLTTGIDWSNNADFTIAHRNGGHQRSFAWPFGAGNDGFIDDFGVLGENVTGAEAAAIFNLATNTDLTYDFGAAIELLDLHRDADPNAEVILDDLTWVFSDDPTAFTGGLGEVTGSGGEFAILLGNGTGVITQAAPVPEPAARMVWLLAGLALAVARKRRK